MSDEMTFRLQRYEFGLLILAMAKTVEEARNLQNPVLEEMILDLLRKMQAQVRTGGDVQ